MPVDQRALPNCVHLLSLAFRCISETFSKRTMTLQRTSLIFRTAAAAAGKFRKTDGGEQKLHFRPRTTTPSGAILPEPKRTRFGFLGVVCSVVAGLVIGATLSKMMANFLEEKELFVPSDDDDDDD